MDVPQAIVRRGRPVIFSTAASEANWSLTADARAHQDGPE